MKDYLRIGVRQRSAPVQEFWEDWASLPGLMQSHSTKKRLTTGMRAMSDQAWFRPMSLSLAGVVDSKITTFTNKHSDSSGESTD
jgi:hypothetical protein